MARAVSTLTLLWKSPYSSTPKPLAFFTGKTIEIWTGPMKQLFHFRMEIYRMPFILAEDGWINIFPKSGNFLTYFACKPSNICP
jgi:hypothetical protein